MDELTLKALQSITAPRMRDFTCLVWELNENASVRFGENAELSSAALSRTVDAGEQILDIIRLFLFTPGQDASIGRVGSLGGGITGIWIGDAENCQFIARKTSNFQLVQEPIERGLKDLRKIYNHDVFRELGSVVCSGAATDPTLSLVLKCLRALRESRDLQSFEARFLRLAAIAEHLARKKQGKRLQGTALREEIANLASQSRREIPDILQTVRDLWDHARNPLTHSAEIFEMLGRDAKHDIGAMEKLVFNMIEATVLQWRVEGLREDAETHDLSCEDEGDIAADPADRCDLLDVDDPPF